MADETTALAVAEWMCQRVTEQRYLPQDQAAYEIAARFGDRFVYINDNGNLAINRRVLAEFRKLTPNSVVWENGERLWRFREVFDTPGRRAD